LHDQEILAVDLHLGARPLAEQHGVASLQVDRDQFAVLVAAARADGDDLALRGLLFGGVGNDDAAFALFLGINALDDDAVVKRTELHGSPPKLLDNLGLLVADWFPPPAPGRHIGAVFLLARGNGKFLSTHLRRVPTILKKLVTPMANAVVMGTPFAPPTFPVRGLHAGGFPLLGCIL